MRGYPRDHGVFENRANNHFLVLDTSTAEHQWKFQHIPHPVVGGMTQCSQVAYNGKYYCVFQTAKAFFVDPMRFVQFDPVSLTIVQLQTPPISQNHVQLLVDKSNNRLLMLPGRSSNNTYTTQVYAYDLLRDAWQPDIHWDVLSDGRVSWQYADGTAVIFGGQQAEDRVLMTDFYVFDGRSSQFYKCTCTYNPLRFQVFAAGVNELPDKRLLVVGGSIAAGPFGTRDVHAVDWRKTTQDYLKTCDIVNGSSKQPAEIEIIAAFYGPYVVTDRMKDLVRQGVVLFDLQVLNPEFFEVPYVAAKQSLVVIMRKHGVTTVRSCAPTVGYSVACLLTS